MNRNQLLSSLIARLLIALLTCIAAFAQSDAGSIAGFVNDPSGAVVPGAKVTVTNEGTREERAVVSDSQGHYTVPNLLPGLYKLKVETTGFRPLESPHNRLSANSALSWDAKLEVGAATETLQVLANATPLETESGAVKREIDSQQLQAQELNGRNPIFMTALLPGVMSTSTLGDFNFTLSNGGAVINGARTWDTAITMDGAPAVRTRANGTQIGVGNVDALEEVQVLTADYAAEYGRAAGGQIRMVTKSGTRDFHGGASEYLRNSSMNANTWVRNLSSTTDFASPFRYNDFGFNFGGPVYIPKKFNADRQKFFVFVAEEWTRYRFTDTAQQAVPTTLMRQGNFSELLEPNPWYKAGTVIYDPTTCPSVGAAACAAFPGNIIPQSRLSHNGQAIMNAYPAPTPGFQLGSQNWIAQAAHPIDQRKGTLNGDFLPTDRHHIEFRRTDFDYTEDQPFDNGSSLTSRQFNRPNQTNTLAWIWTISPTMVNEARVTASLDDVYIGVDQSLPGFNRSQLGIDYPFIFPNGKDIPGKIPSLNVPNFFGLNGGPYPSHSTGPIYTASDSLTKVWHSHTFKVGFYFEYAGENDGDQINTGTVPGGSNNQSGTFTFTDGRTGLGATSGVGMANLALGLADSYTEIGPRAYTAWRAPMYEFFAQDSWKVNSKLHIDYGIRESIVPPWYSKWGNADYFDPSLYNPAQAVNVDPKSGNVLVGSGNQYNGVVIPGLSGFPSQAAGRGVTAAQTNAYNALFDPSLPRGYYATTQYFQPRLGVAYQLTDKTVVRGGIGRFVTRQGVIDNIFPGGNSPFQPYVTVNNISVDNPGAALTSNVAAPITMTTFERNLKQPEAWNWNVTVERELPFKSVVSAAYVAHRGLHGWTSSDLNQVPAGTLQANPGINLNYLRPYKGFANIQTELSSVNSTYNSFQLTWIRRFTGNSAFSFAYTLSKSMDSSSHYKDIAPDTYDTSNLWGPSNFDTRHMVAISYTYDLPIFKSQSGVAGKLLGGWELSGTTQFQTGNPCSVATNNDFAGVGEFGSLNCTGAAGAQFWVMNGTPQVLGGFAGPNGTSKYISTTDASGQPLFTQPAPGTFNLQHGIRNNIYNPGFQNWNLGLFKKFAINDSTGFEFRAEAYNFINHPNLGSINLNPTSSQFGEVTQKSTSNPRQLQLSLRFFF